MNKVDAALKRSRHKRVKWVTRRSGIKVRCVACTEMIGEDDQMACKITYEGDRAMRYESYHVGCKGKKVGR